MMGDVLRMAGDGDAGKHHGLGFDVLQETDAGNVHGPHLLCGSSWPAESLLSWGGRKMGVSLDACRCWWTGEHLAFCPSCFLVSPLPCQALQGRMSHLAWRPPPHR